MRREIVHMRNIPCVAICAVTERGESGCSTHLSREAPGGVLVWLSTANTERPSLHLAVLPGCVSLTKMLCGQEAKGLQGTKRMAGMGSPDREAQLQSYQCSQGR